MIPKFRPGTNDESIFITASQINEYCLPDIINPNDVIIDIGSHIGGFVYGCLIRGARKIYAYEALKENYDIAISSFEEEIKYGYVKIFNYAVYRSDIKIPVLYNSGFAPELNTGISVVTNGLCHICIVNPDTNTRNYTKGQPIGTIALDEIIDYVIKTENIERIKLIKTDCEGSEYPILMTSKKLQLVDYICGEYHLINPSNFSYNGKTKLDIQDLSTYLDKEGFNTVSFGCPLNALVGMFYSKKKGTNNIFKNIAL